MLIIMKRLMIIIILMTMLCSCNEKKENIKALFNIEDKIDIALRSNDAYLVSDTIEEIEQVEVKFPEHQSLKEKKYSLQIRLERFDDAIETIDTLLELSPDDIDNRIIQGILLEITGKTSKSKEVLEIALRNINIKIKKMLKKDEKKILGRKINRILILKLLNKDTPEEYEIIKNDPSIGNHPEILKLLYLLEEGSREQIINRYR